MSRRRAVALATIETIETEGLVDRAREIGKIMVEGLRSLGDPRIGDIRGRGAMIAVELVEPGTDQPDPELTRAVASAAHQQGLVVLTCGTYGNVLRFLPPLSMPDHLLVEGLELLAQIFRDA